MFLHKGIIQELNKKCINKNVNTKIFIIFATSFRMLKALGVITWRWDTYILKAFSGRFGFDILRISQIRTNGQKQSNGNAPWRCRLYMFLTLFIRVGHLYIHRRGAFSVARFDQLGRCESLQNVDRAQDWLHVFVCMAK